VKPSEASREGQAFGRSTELTDGTSPPRGDWAGSASCRSDATEGDRFAPELCLGRSQIYPDPIERFLIRLGWIRLREPN